MVVIFFAVPPRSEGAVVKVRGEINDEKQTAAFRAASAVVNNFELQPNQGWSTHGYRVKLTIQTDRRSVSVGASELTRLRDAGDDFSRLIEVINSILPSESAIKGD